MSRKKPGWLPPLVTGYLASPSSDQSLYDTYDLIGTGLSVSMRKMAAFLFQNSEPDIARLLGIDVDGSLNSALKRLRKSLRKNIDNNGGGYDEYIDAVTLHEEVTTYHQVAGEFDSAGLQDDHKTLVFIGDTVQTATFVPMVVKLEMLHEACHRAGSMRNELRAKRVTKLQSKVAVALRTSYKKEALDMKSTYNDWLESAANRIDLVDLLLSSAPSHALDVLWAYLKIISKDEQMDMPGVDRGIKLKVYYASFYPDLAILEQHESSRERKYWQRVLGLLENSGNMAQNEGKHHKSNAKKSAMKQYRAARTYTALTYAKMWLDPNKERSKHLLRYLQKMVDKDEEKRISKKQSKTERARQKRVAKANEKRFAGGRYSMGELKNAGMALIAKQVKS